MSINGDGRIEVRYRTYYVGQWPMLIGADLWAIRANQAAVTIAKETRKAYIKRGMTKDEQLKIAQKNSTKRRRKEY